MLGSVWNGAHAGPRDRYESDHEAELAGNDVKRIVTKSGIRVHLVDTPGKESITLATPRSNRVVMTERAEATGRPAVVLHTEGDIRFEAGGRVHHQAQLHSHEVALPAITNSETAATFINAAFTQPLNPPTNSRPASAAHVSKCAAIAESDKQLAAAARKRMEQLSTSGSGDQSACRKRALALGGTVDQFDRYRAALPGARAALDVNQLGDKPGSQSTHPKCVTRLPDDAEGLNKALHLPSGTITDSMLRDDKSGFRAAMYRDEATGKLMLVPRDTEPHSLADWKTNTDNGQGLLTKQYREMRILTGKLVDSNVNFDEVGYSKGGGLAQEGGLVNPNGNVLVFNSAGIPATSVGRAPDANLGSLADRTSAFSSQGDFLTYFNNTTDPDQQIRNAEWLKGHLAQSSSSLHPLESGIGIDYQNSETQGKADPDFSAAKSAYISGLEDLDTKAKQNREQLATNPLFPPVRSGVRETVPNTEPGFLEHRLAGDPLAPVSSNAETYNEQMDGKLYQHQMSIVADGMEKTVSDDQAALQSFTSECR